MYSRGSVPFSINFLYFGRNDLFLPGGPIVLSVCMAYLIAQIWLSILSTAMATIFICALEDWRMKGIGQSGKDNWVVRRKLESG